MDSKHHGFMHGWIGVQVQAFSHSHGGRQCTMRNAYILLVALQLLFSRSLSFRIIASCFARPPSSVHTYSYVSTPGLYRLDMGLSLAVASSGSKTAQAYTAIPSFLLGLCVVRSVGNENALM